MKQVFDADSGCAGKEQMISRDIAELALNRIRSRDGFRGRGLSVYRCPACNHWHVGNNEPDYRRRKNRKLK